MTANNTNIFCDFISAKFISCSKHIGLYEFLLGSLLFSIPNLTVPDTKEYSIGKYGRLHKKFLKENYPVYYSTLFMTEKLFNYLEKIDLRAKNELDRLIPLLAEQQGVTEQLNAENQLKWVGMMNNIKAQVEEIIYAEIVYVRKDNVKR